MNEKEYTETVDKVMEAFPELKDAEEKKLLAMGQAVAIDVLKDRKAEQEELIEETEESLNQLIEKQGEA